jgi:predicted amidophosphoribosyltransferase
MIEEPIDQYPTEICPGCGNEIDPDWCHCGDSKQSHNGMNQNHGFIPMGCVCGYAIPPVKADAK